jgi:chloramphenicol-sensitive protein RarD
MAPHDPRAELRAGLIAAASAYGIWGFLPLYLKFVGFASPWEVLAQRILWSIPFAALGVAVSGGFAQARAALTQPGVLGALVLSALLVAGNWAVYVWAVSEARVIEASLAYFITPLVNVTFGVAFFSERLRRRQIAALALAALGVVVQGVALGGLPWVSLALCITWSLYGLMRKRAPVPAAAGLLAETLILAVPAAAALALMTGRVFGASPGQDLLLALSGPATALPLILFAFGARRLPFATLGLLQFIAPSLQFLVGVAFGEPLTPLRIASFVLIWMGLGVFSWDAWRVERAQRREVPAG